MAVSRTSPSSPDFTLLTLGRASLVDATGVVVAEQRRRIALLALIASAGERGIARDKVLSCLSPESSTESARHALHQLLYYLRRQLGDDAFLGIDPLRLNPAAITWDVVQFEAALDRGDVAEAVAMYHGPFLDGLYLDSAEFEFWLGGQRSRLAARHADALVHLAGDAEGREDWPAAIGCWSQLTALDPLSGRYAVGLMRVLAAAGDSAGALRHGRMHATVVAHELGTNGDDEVAAFARSLTPRVDAGLRRPGPAPRVRRLAVLPLETAASDSTSIAEGLTRELISALTRAGIRVIGYESVGKYAGGSGSLRDAARALDVDAIAMGRLEQRGSTIAISLDVVNPMSGENRWATSVTVDLSAISGLIDTTARRLSAWILGSDAVARSERVVTAPVTSASAYTSYLLGMRRAERVTAPDMTEAIADLEQAIVADGDFAPAHAGLAFALTVAIDYAILPADQAFRAAEPAIDRALRLDPNLALAHLAKARLLQLRDWNWKDAEAEYLRAIDLEPGPRAVQAYSWFLEWYIGRADEGVAMGERAVSLDPSSVVMHVGLAWRLRGADRNDRAIEEAGIALALDPSASDAHWVLAEAYLRQADFERAEHHARQYIVTSGNAVPANSTTLGEIYARTGRVSEARAFANRLELRAMHDGPSLVALARTEMALGNCDRALSLLEQAVARRVFTIPFQPYWDPIRGEPRFQALLKSQGL